MLAKGSSFGRTLLHTTQNIHRKFVFDFFFIQTISLRIQIFYETAFLSASCAWWARFVIRLLDYLFTWPSLIFDKFRKWGNRDCYASDELSSVMHFNKKKIGCLNLQTQWTNTYNGTPRLENYSWTEGLAVALRILSWAADNVVTPIGCLGSRSQSKDPIQWCTGRRDTGITPLILQNTAACLCAKESATLFTKRKNKYFTIKI